VPFANGESARDCDDEITGPDRPTCFFNSSPMLDLFAPGGAIDPNGSLNQYKGYLGTSLAVPHVEGAVALLMQAGGPGLTAPKAIDLLIAYGTPITDPRQGRTTPRIDVDRAMKALPVKRPQ
jgi:subtilisin family serine protease